MPAADRTARNITELDGPSSVRDYLEPAGVREPDLPWCLSVLGRDSALSGHADSYWLPEA
jgi:hypothetical protein